MNISSNENNKGPIKKLMVSGLIKLKGYRQATVEVRRGMAVFSKDGQEMGKVAALVYQDGTIYALAILLGRLPEAREYRLVPVKLIEDVEDECVRLQIPGQATKNLLLWNSEVENGW